MVYRKVCTAGRRVIAERCNRIVRIPLHQVRDGGGNIILADANKDKLPLVEPDNTLDRTVNIDDSADAQPSRKDDPSSSSTDTHHMHGSEVVFKLRDPELKMTTVLSDRCSLRSATQSQFEHTFPMNLTEAVCKIEDVIKTGLGDILEECSTPHWPNVHMVGKHCEWRYWCTGKMQPCFPLTESEIEMLQRVCMLTISELRLI